MKARERAALLVLCAALGVRTAGAARPAAELRALDGLVRTYDLILDARFEQVDAELRRACPPAPLEACEVLAATALWWRIQLDPESPRLDAEFSTAAERAIASTEAWAARAPKEADAWFYLGGAYAVRVQFRVLRNEKLAAARDGKRILHALERALAIDPAIDDAYFAIGMYKYYADVAPAGARILRVLLLLPGGDRKQGLEQMLRARTRGRLLQGEADYQLHIIYLWYERQTARALQILEGLRARYPGNPLFLAETARIQDEYLHDPTASLESWNALLGAVRDQRSNAAELAEARSRLAIAQLLESVHETDRAMEHLRAVVALRPKAPFGAWPLAHLRLGEAYDRIGDRSAALQSYRTALSLAPYPDEHRVRSTVSARTRRAPDDRHAEAYRSSLEGWRLFEKGDTEGAEAALERSLALNDADPVAHYRMGRVLQAGRKETPALEQFEWAIRGARNCPAPILGSAYLEAARLHEHAGHRERALARYGTAASLLGAAAETHAAASRALARLRASTPR